MDEILEGKVLRDYLMHHFSMTAEEAIEKMVEMGHDVSFADTTGSLTDSEMYYF